MQITGTYRFRATPQQVWRLLLDPAVLARALPGCKELTADGVDKYRARLEMGLAAIKGSYTGTLSVTDKEEPRRMALAVEAGGSTGWVRITGRLGLIEMDGGTEVAYSWDVQAGGPVAMVGQRVLGGVARWLIGEFFAAVAREPVEVERP